MGLGIGMCIMMMTSMTSRTLAGFYFSMLHMIFMVCIGRRRESAILGKGAKKKMGGRHIEVVGIEKKKKEGHTVGILHWYVHV